MIVLIKENIAERKKDKYFVAEREREQWKKIVHVYKEN